MCILTHAQLEQSDVYELQKGDWEKERNHWKKDSLYLTDDFFDHTETGTIFHEGLQNFNWFGPNRVLPKEWAAMMDRAMQSKDKRTKQLMQRVDEWVQECLAEHPMFYILGP